MKTIYNIQFDTAGNLIPSGMSTIDINFFYSFFVEQFKDSSTRKDLFCKYTDYIEKLFLALNTNWFFQYIGGSFVTNKENPQDIDLINCIKAKDFDKFDEQKQNDILQNFFHRYKDNGEIKSGQSKEIFSVDAYLVILHPKDSPNFEASKKRLIGGQKGLSEYTRDGSKRGFIKILFTEDAVKKIKQLREQLVSE